MLMDRKHLKIPFTLSSAPDWVCPTCLKAPLRVKKETFVKAEGKASRDNRAAPYWGPEYIEFVFSCLLCCTNDQCAEIVACSGSGAVDAYMTEDEQGYPDQEWEDHFSPKVFQPALQVI